MLIRLIKDETVPAESVASAVDALPAVLPPREETFKELALAALVRAMGRESLRSKRSDMGAALRQLSTEDFPDEPRFWQHWWKDYQRKKGNSGSAPRSGE